MAFAGIFGKNDHHQDKTAPAEVAEQVVMPAGLCAAIALLKGRRPANDLATNFMPSTLLPISAEIAKEEAEAMKNPQIGQLIPGKGVFLGIWSPKDRGDKKGKGKSLGKTFNLFAAPCDLGLDEKGQGTKLVAKYNDAVKASTKVNLMGHKGFNHVPDGYDADLYKALTDGSYKGEWFMPTRDIVGGANGGLDVDGNKVQTDTLYEHRNKGVLQGTFTTASGSVNAHWYWSCTEHREHPSFVWSVQSTDGNEGYFSEDNSSLSSRLVRAELRP